MRIITLTTDFGTRDWFVGAMKGVLLSLHPRATLVDLTHGIPPGDLRAAAFALAAACPCFPRGTIHLVVVDPGVGGSRAPVAVRTKHSMLVGPDNGVLALAAHAEGIRSIRLLDNPRLWRPTLSRTFHGRDLFAPVAAHLARGRPFRQVGSVRTTLQPCPWPSPRHVGGRMEGEVVYLDHFGNAITNLPNACAQLTSGAALQVRARGRSFRVPLGDCYAAVAPGRLVAVAGSTGHLEIAVNLGRAVTRLGLKVGTKVCLAGGSRRG